jgi:hypothetical protein
VEANRFSEEDISFRPDFIFARHGFLRHFLHSIMKVIKFFFLCAWMLFIEGLYVIQGRNTMYAQGLGTAWSSVGFTLCKSDGKAFLQVAKEDLPERMLWETASEACMALGGGWRLPTRNELDMMYRQLYKQGKGNFKPYWYWSRSQYVMHMHFGSGFVSNDFYSQFNEFNVRAVRNIP